jgi:hypothetical protein
MLKLILQTVAILLLVLTSPFANADGKSCGVLFSFETKDPHSAQTTLPLLKLGNIPSELPELIYKYHSIKMKQRNARIKNEPINLTQQIAVAKKEALEKITAYLSADPQLSGLSKKQYLLAAKRVLDWEIIAAKVLMMDHKAAIEMERYYLYLLKNNIDPEAQPSNWEKIFQDFGFEYIFHAGRKNFLLDILKGQKLLSAAETKSLYGMGGDTSFVYFGSGERRTKAERPHFNNDNYNPGSVWNSLVREQGFAILLPVKALDSFKWSHGNTFWQYGESGKFSLPRKNLTAGFLNYLHNQTMDNLLLYTPEWLFSEAIDLQKTDFRIILHPSARDEFIKTAKENNIPQWIIDRIE